MYQYIFLVGLISWTPISVSNHMNNTDGGNELFIPILNSQYIIFHLVHDKIRKNGKVCFAH
jgi:hypothetical protein